MTSLWKTIDDVLDYAIASEELAISAYTQMAAATSSEKTRILLLRFSAEEVDHKKRLRAMKRSSSFSKVAMDLKAMEEVVKPSPRDLEQMTPEEAVAFAITTEKDSEALYLALAEMLSDDDELGAVFKMLAFEERAHTKFLEQGLPD